MKQLCEGRVVIVTGAGRGIGRAHALGFARHGARVVVNDLGAEVDGTGSSSAPAGEVVDLIRASGGEAVANGDDVANWNGAARLISTTLEHFGRLDTLVCNAGILRDHMIVSMTEEDWDAVMRVHLKGHFCPLHHAAVYWREQAKQSRGILGRVVLTSSAAGLYGNVGQLNYSAAKAGIATMGRVAAAELKRYNVSVNVLAPAARTRMSEHLLAAGGTGSNFDVMAPENNSPLVVWLGSDEAQDISGQVFETIGGALSIAENWRKGPAVNKGTRWEASELGPVVRDLVARSKQEGLATEQMELMPGR